MEVRLKRSSITEQSKILAHLRQQLTTVVKMKMRNNDAIDVRRDWAFGNDVGEVGEPAFVVVAHVHSAVQHHILSADTEENTASTHVLAGSERRHFDLRHLADLTFGQGQQNLFSRTFLEVETGFLELPGDKTTQKQRIDNSAVRQQLNNRD
jgi:hypothetical protein